MPSINSFLQLVVPADGLDPNALAEIAEFIEARRQRSTPTAPDPITHEPNSALAAAAGPAVVDPSGWTVGEIRLVLSWLDQGRIEWRLRAAVLREALTGSGSVTRVRIHELGHPADQSLTGFAKPVMTATRELIRAGRLPVRDRPVLLEPVYGMGPGQATGYQVPSAVYLMWRASNGPSDGQTPVLRAS